MIPAGNYTGAPKGPVPGGALIYCRPTLSDTIAAQLVCAGADVNVDVFPKERPGYKLIHIAACHFASGIWVRTAVRLMPECACSICFGNHELHLHIEEPQVFTLGWSPFARQTPLLCLELDCMAI